MLYDCPSIGLNQNKDNAPQKRENDRKCQNDYHKRGIGLIPLSISLDIKHKVIFLEIFPNNRDKTTTEVNDDVELGDNGSEIQPEGIMNPSKIPY